MKYKLTIYFVNQVPLNKQGNSLEVVVEVTDIYVAVRNLIKTGYPQFFDEKKGTGLIRAVCAVAWERIDE
jgi:hypothetical protein